MVRLKTRYILFDVVYPPSNDLQIPNRSQALLQLHQTSPSINLKTISEAVKKNIKLLFGDKGEGQASLTLMVKYFSSKTSTGIIRCSRDYFEYVIAALTIINKLNNKDVIIRVIKVSGTIKKSENHAIERNRRLMRDMNLKKDELLDDFDNIIKDDDDDE